MGRGGNLILLAVLFLGWPIYRLSYSTERWTLTRGRWKTDWRDTRDTWGTPESHHKTKSGSPPSNLPLNLKIISKTHSLYIHPRLIYSAVWSLI